VSPREVWITGIVWRTRWRGAERWDGAFSAALPSREGFCDLVVTPLLCAGKPGRPDPQDGRQGARWKPGSDPGTMPPDLRWIPLRQGPTRKSWAGWDMSVAAGGGERDSRGGLQHLNSGRAGANALPSFQRTAETISASDTVLAQLSKLRPAILPSCTAVNGRREPHGEEAAAFERGQDALARIVPVKATSTCAGVSKTASAKDLLVTLRLRRLQPRGTKFAPFGRPAKTPLALGPPVHSCVQVQGPRAGPPVARPYARLITWSPIGLRNTLRKSRDTGKAVVELARLGDQARHHHGGDGPSRSHRKNEPSGQTSRGLRAGDRHRVRPHQGNQVSAGMGLARFDPGPRCCAQRPQGLECNEMSKPPSRLGCWAGQ